MGEDVGGWAQVQTTAGSREEARAIASSVLASRKAACVQIVGPIESRYWWEGRLEVAEEWLCLLKTTQAAVEDLCEAIRTHHSYDTPEITVTPLTGGSEPYLSWIEAETRS
ncbi:MAG TPA: divalent-cation tolerance protein CutA [Acidimicrobiales bacterium]|nr:divalent-cation tolerance protein CutA [Acidimicrobiales bacterium]